MSEGQNLGRTIPYFVKVAGVDVNVSAPGKVILHGEHSVVYGKLALAASLGLRSRLKLAEINAPGQVFIELPVSEAGFVFDLMTMKEYLIDNPLPLIRNKSEFSWEHPELLHHESLIDAVENFLNLPSNNIPQNIVIRMSLTALFYLISGILGSINVDVTPFILVSTSELTVGAGTGSSASFLVTVAAALVQYVKLKSVQTGNFSKEGYAPSFWDVHLAKFSQRELDLICRWALSAEKIIHGSPSGLDNTICTYGSMVEFRKGLAPKLVQLSHPFNVLLINTNVSRETKHLVSKVAQLHHKYPDLTNNILNAMEDVAFEALKHVSNLSLLRGGEGEGNVVAQIFEELGNLASMNHSLLSALGVSHLKLDEAVYLLSEYGFHGKLTGAGGGGYAIALVQPNAEPDVVEKVVQLLNSRGFSVIFTSLGGVGVTID